MSPIIRLGGVPEHFNLPIQLAIERGEMEAANINLQWTYYPGGTGAMKAALATGELDMAILLTEGYLAAVQSGLEAKIVKVYIDTPLSWGIYTGSTSSTKSIYDHTTKKYAISRLGSGSHLMAMIHAQQRGVEIAPDDIVEVKSLEGAMLSLMNNETQVFYWEKLTTQKYIDLGEVKQIGEFSAPWSSFLLIATDSALQSKHEGIYKVLDVINSTNTKYKADERTPFILEERFGMSSHDIQLWLNSTIWNTDYNIRLLGLENAIEALKRIGQIEKIDINALCADGLSLV